MGFIDSVKSALGSGEQNDGKSDEIAAEFQEEIEMEEEMAGVGEIEEEPEQEQAEEWDTAYQFAEDMIEPSGFMSMKEFIGKYMYYEVRNSPRYRDRLKHGTETIEMVSDATARLESLRGEGSGNDFGEIADKLQDADRAIQAADSLSGKDDMMTRDLINLGYEALDTVGEAVVSQTGEVNSTITESDREI